MNGKELYAALYSLTELGVTEEGEMKALLPDGDLAEIVALYYEPEHGRIIIALREWHHVTI